MAYDAAYEAIKAQLNEKYIRSYNEFWEKEKTGWRISAPPKWLELGFNAFVSYEGYPETRLYFELGEDEEVHARANPFLKEVYLKLGPHWLEEGNRPGILSVLADEMAHIEHPEMSRHSPQFDDLAFRLAEEFADTHPNEAKIFEWRE